MDYLKINKDTWNKRTEIHWKSDFYNNKDFIAGANSLPELDQQLLPDVKGKSLLHLQCHFGQDTISWQRLGATTTGVDLSPQAIERAQELAKLTNQESNFICSDVYELPNKLDKKFDIVYTSYGTIGWLPDIDKWASVVKHFLKPGGTFLIIDFHPVLWMYDNDFNAITHRYFNTAPIIEEEGSYTDGSEELNATCVSWNHGLGEIVMSLINQGLSINLVEEYDYSNYDCFNDCESIGEKKYRIKKLGDKVPYMYAVRASN